MEFFDSHSHYNDEKYNIDRNEIENRSDDEDDDNNKFEIPTCCKRYVSIGVKTADDLIPEEDLEKLTVNNDDC